MPDQFLNNNNLTPVSQPSETPSENDNTLPQSPPIPETAAPINPSIQSPKKHQGLRSLLIAATLLLIVVITVAIASQLHKSGNKLATASKKDIAVLNYGILNSSGVAQYPISYPYANDTINIALQLFEGLVGYQSQTKIVPLLATSWTNPNDTTWVFNLRSGVKFHSGRIMTAQDVKFTLDYVLAHQTDPASPAFFVANAIKKVDATNDRQVTITTSSPDAVLLNQLSLLGIVDSKAKLGDYNAGTGPYMVSAGTLPNISSIDLKAVNNYWGGHVYTREVKIALYDSVDQLANDTLSGKLDLAGNFNASQLNKVKSRRVINVPDQGLNYIGLNTNKAGSPLQSAAARQAVADALNIPDILKAGGLQGQQDSQIVPLLLPGHNPAIQNTPFDPAKAKQLLTSVKTANVPLTFAYSGNESLLVSEMVKELNAVGFNFKPIDVSDFTTFTNDTLAGKYDIYTAADTSATVDGRDILNDLLIGNSDYDSPQIDSLMTQAGGTLSPATRINDMQQIAAIVATDKPIIPLFTQSRAYALTKPYVVKADQPSLQASAYFWKVYQ